MPYRVAARPARAGQWILTGPVFRSIDEARQYMDTLREPVKRMVRTQDGAPAVLPGRPAARMTGRAGYESPGLHPGLDRKRLEFARYLMKTKRIQEWPLRQRRAGTAGARNDSSRRRAAAR